MITPNFFTDFFNIFMLPTLIFDKNFNMIKDYKWENSFETSPYVKEAINILKESDFNTGSNIIELDNDVEFTYIQFVHYGNKAMTILIGPYIINDNDIVIGSDVISVNSDTLAGLKKLYSFFINNNSNCKNSSTKEKSPCVSRAIEYIEENYTNDISIDELCSKLNINKCYFCSIFKKETGQTFINYLNTYKINKSKELLKNPNNSLLHIAHSVGFNNQSYYSTVFKKITSQTPLEYRDEVSKTIL